MARAPNRSPERDWLLATPALLTIVVLMLVPMTIVGVYSLLTATPYGGVTQPLTSTAYVRLLYDRDLDDALAFDPTYLAIAWRSLVQAAAATFVCVAIGLPLAWYMATRPPRLRQALVLLVTIPFWTNLLIRLFAWVPLLRDNGLVNILLQRIGLTHAPITFLYTDGAILMGLVYANLPFMTLPIYAALEKVDPRLIEAAHDLYAGRGAIMRRIVWPLAKPGIAAGCVLVFVPTLGAFLAPDILGGGGKLMLGSLIQQQFSTSRNWPFGAALSVMLMSVVLVAMAFGAWRRAGRENAA